MMSAVVLAALVETHTHFCNILWSMFCFKASKTDISHFTQETTESLEVKVERISGIAADSISHIDAKLKIPGKVAGHRKIVSQLGTLQKMLESLFTSKHSSSYGGDGSIAKIFQKHFAELWRAIPRLGMLKVTAKAYSKGLISTELKDTIFSVDGTSGGRKASLLLSTIERRIKFDQSAFDTFVGILRSEPAYEHLAEKLTS